MNKLWLAVTALMLGLAPLAVWSQAAHPFGAPESGGGIAGPDWLHALFAQISVWQTHFYRQLTGAVRAWQADGTAAWGLLGLSFAYGVFHALGPGHGKAVITAYVLANRQTARNGAILSLVAALVQALVAIALVTVMALLLNATAVQMNRATRGLETASYLLITLLGAWLVWAKVLRPWLLRRAKDLHRTSATTEKHHHHHHHECGCGHTHAPPVEEAAGPLSWRRAASAILAMGLRPCSGALIVLVFALSQNFFLAGIAAALAMGLGTGLTVACLAVFAVMAAGAATRVSAYVSGPWMARLRMVIEAFAACFILLMGLLLLGGHLSGAALS